MTTKAEESGPGAGRSFVWDVGTGQLRHTIAEDFDDLPEFTFSPDGRYLAAGAWLDRKDANSSYLLQLWDVTNGERRISLTLPSELSLVVITFSPDGRFLIIHRQFHQVRPSYLEFWEIDSGQVRARLECDSQVPDFGPGGQSFAVVRRTGETSYLLSVWALESSEPALRLVREHVLPEFPTISPDLRSFLTLEYLGGGMAEGMWVHGEVWVRFCDMETGALRDRVLLSGPGRHDHSCGFSDDGRLLLGHATGSGGDPEFTVWEVGERLERRGSFVSRDLLSPDGRWRANNDFSGAELSETTSSRPSLSLQVAGDYDQPDGIVVFCGPNVPSTSVAFSPDSKTLLVTGLHHHTSKVPRWRWALHKLVPSVADSDSVDRSYPVARLWRLSDGEQAAEFRGCQAGLFSGDGKSLALLDDDGTIRVWDMPPRPPRALAFGTAFVLWLGALGCGRLARAYRARRLAARMLP